MKLVIVSGLSGSGKTVALHTLEDLGFYSIDNLPLFLLKDLTQGLGPERDEVFQRTAVGIDARTETADLAGLPGLLAAARERGIDTRLIFVDAHSDALMRRFSETRRRHPLTSGGTAPSPTPSSSSASCSSPWPRRRTCASTPP